MNSIVNSIAFGDAVTVPVSVSRGVLALQGTGPSVAGTFGIDAFGTQVKTVCSHQLNGALRQDAASGSWHPAAIEAAGVFAFAGYEQAFTLPETPEVSDEGGMQAARLRTAHQAIVIRNRRRCRSR